jgi:hypothetical protein
VHAAKTDDLERAKAFSVERMQDVGGKVPDDPLQDGYVFLIGQPSS